MNPALVGKAFGRRGDGDGEAATFAATTSVTFFADRRIGQDLVGCEVRKEGQAFLAARRLLVYDRVKPCTKKTRQTKLTKASENIVFCTLRVLDTF
jgi:hypothetical protein